ncbi:MAG: DUF2256 and DUF3253 domain-containing protein [Planctomycetes bacterium]|nr:DUF2256 and DUF3253 domain-containing protein [Planctomycetota bacterium]
MSLPEKVCATCGRRFAWRARWSSNWDAVRHCSRACRGGPSALGRRCEAAILALLARDPGASICPSEAARAVRPEAWRPLLERVRQAARRLAHEGALEITQRGRAVDPCEVRGPIRLRLKRGPGA